MEDRRAAWAADVATHREIDGRRWRVSDPRIPEPLRQRLVDELMAARRAVRSAGDDATARRDARDRVHDAKVALGERGLRWWAAEADPEAADDRIHRADRALARTAPGTAGDAADASAGDAAEASAGDGGAADAVSAVTSRSVADVHAVLGTTG